MAVNEKNRNLIEGLVYGLLGLIIGILFIVIKWDTLLTILSIVFGVLVIIFSLLPFIESCKNLKYKTQVAISQFISSLMRVIFGLLLIFCQGALTIVIGILMLLFSLIDICLAKEKWLNELRNQLPAIVLAILLLFFGFGPLLNILLMVFGWIFIICSIIIFVLTLLKYFKVIK